MINQEAIARLGIANEDIEEAIQMVRKAATLTDAENLWIAYTKLVDAQTELAKDLEA